MEKLLWIVKSNDSCKNALHHWRRRKITEPPRWKKWYRKPSPNNQSRSVLVIVSRHHTWFVLGSGAMRTGSRKWLLNFETRNTKKCHEKNVSSTPLGDDHPTLNDLRFLENKQEIIKKTCTKFQIRTLKGLPTYRRPSNTYTSLHPLHPPRICHDLWLQKWKACKDFWDAYSWDATFLQDHLRMFAGIFLLWSFWFVNHIVLQEPLQILPI